ncbi:uncharacterized protein CLUP02_01921 [Colletotrichum lupini]|uniref:Uncharacterized protein n=1 Tax=Colletotrichum lupini TaxID=145971 RepID=A0A9Q8SDY0_9PEZI|nr:uncharacterized protein CLUP02_01921 [Colletotrichum lupini]UQC75268.1 hypothetical protein CLUP02_01921 [Colletotrichum lupini]
MPLAFPLLAKYSYHLGLRKILTDDILDPTQTQKSAKIFRRRFRKRRTAAGLPRHGHPRKRLLNGGSVWVRLVGTSGPACGDVSGAYPGCQVSRLVIGYHGLVAARRSDISEARTLRYLTMSFACFSSSTGSHLEHFGEENLHLYMYDDHLAQPLIHDHHKYDRAFIAEWAQWNDFSRVILSPQRSAIRRAKFLS